MYFSQRTIFFKHVPAPVKKKNSQYANFWDDFFKLQILTWFRIQNLKFRIKNRTDTQKKFVGHLI
jgi:hypothetical protein